MRTTMGEVQQWRTSDGDDSFDDEPFQLSSVPLQLRHRLTVKQLLARRGWRGALLSSGQDRTAPEG